MPECPYGRSHVQLPRSRRPSGRRRRSLPSPAVPAPRRLAAVLAALVVVTAGCALGPRPHLTEEAAALGGAPGTPSGDAAADRVLGLLEAVGDGPFTATYQVTRKLGLNVTTGTVVQDGDRRSVTVGD